MMSDSGGSRTYRFGKDGIGSLLEIIIDNNSNSSTTLLNFKYTYSETTPGSNSGSLKVYISGSEYVYTWPYTLIGNTLIITDSNGVWVLTKQ